MIQFEEDWHPIFASWAPNVATHHQPSQTRKVLQCPASFRVVKAGFPQQTLEKGVSFPQKVIRFPGLVVLYHIFFWKFHPDILGEMESNLTTHFSTKLKPPPRWDPFWGHQSFIYRNVEGFFFENCAMHWFGLVIFNEALFPNAICVQAREFRCIRWLGRCWQKSL